MRRALLTRDQASDEGTFGTFMSDSSFFCHTGELPWRENESNFSCIPEGTYLCTYRASEKHGDCYHVEGVSGRTAIEIHSANFVGDATKGFKCQLLGCIALGLGVGSLDGQKALISSVMARTLLEQDMNGESFELKIEDFTD